MKKRIGATALGLVIGLLLVLGLRAGEPTSDWETQVRAFDSAFWSAFNAHDPKALANFDTDDVEFYHDLGGPTIGKPALLALHAELLSRPAGYQRSAVAGSIQIFPMRRDRREVYGAIVMGEHEFSILEAGQPTQHLGRARFIHFLVLQGKVWKIARIFSYEHH